LKEALVGGNQLESSIENARLQIEAEKEKEKSKEKDALVSAT